MTDQIIFATRQQQLLWDQELSGQVSDGYWENAMPQNHWERPCRATTFVDPSNVGLTFRPVKGYRFNNDELVKWVGYRMLDYVREEFPDYTEADLRKDLIAIGKMFSAARKGERATHMKEAA